MAALPRPSPGAGRIIAPSVMPAESPRGIPLAVKLLYTSWMAAWVPVYWVWAGPGNFLWLCDVANFVLLAAFWLESPLLVSSQAVGVLLVQLLWAVDFLGALVLGTHPIGGTEYMFDEAKPLWVRSFSLFHLAVPPLLLWAVRRLGYDRRGWRLETALVWLLLPATWWLTDPEKNINWIWRPFGQEQDLLSQPGYVLFLMLANPLLLFLPTHALLLAWVRRTRGRPRLAGPAAPGSG